MDRKTTIKNVNILDLRNTTKETFNTIGFIKNVNIVLVSHETIGYLPGIHSKNLNAVVELPGDIGAQVCMSNVTINESYLQGITSPIFLLVMGKVVVESDVSRELIDSKLGGLSIMGKMICPDSVAGILQAKAKMMLGKTIAYPADAVLVTDSLTLDDDYLQTLQDGTSLFVAGSLRVVDRVSNELISRKIGELQTHGSILCRQEHALAIKGKLAKPSTMTIIPTGHRLIEGQLKLDALTLQTLDKEQLFCLGDIVISQDVDPQLLERAIAKLDCTGAIVCPSRLKDILKSQCDMLDHLVILYEGTLWYVDEDRQLLADQFTYVDGVMTLFIRGELTIDANVSPDAILDRIDRIHNLGNMVCEQEHMPAIEARLGIREGDVCIRKEEGVEQPEQGPSIGNANMMVL